VRIDSALEYMLLTGIVTARLSFVLAYWDAYYVAPITMFDIRDGGFHPWAGVLAGTAVAFVYARRYSALLRPLALAISAGAATAAVVGAIAWAVLERPRDTALPGGTFTSLDGMPMQFHRFAWRPVVVNLWASWCPPCRRKMPVLAEAQARNSDVVFVFANQSEMAEAARAYLEKEDIQIQNVLLDTAITIGRHTGSAALPTTLFFNRDGKLVNVSVDARLLDCAVSSSDPASAARAAEQVTLQKLRPYETTRQVRQRGPIVVTGCCSTAASSVRPVQGCQWLRVQVTLH
jgi:thiol-disulfide isomerase/thioredoxin